MKHLMRISLVALVVALTACSPSRTSRGTGEVVDDTALTARVKTELAQDQGLGEALAINVDTYRGVVSLSGFVNNEQQRQAAASAAKRVNGVREVRNALQIKPKQ